MSRGAILAAQVTGFLSLAVLALAVALIVLRAGLGPGLAVGIGLAMVALGYGVPQVVRIVSGDAGLPAELIVLVYPVCGLLTSLVVLVVALSRWPRPQ